MTILAIEGAILVVVVTTWAVLDRCRIYFRRPPMPQVRVDVQAASRSVPCNCAVCVDRRKFEAARAKRAAAEKKDN